MYTALGRRMTGKTNNLSQKDLTRRNKCLELKVVTKPEEEEKTYLHQQKDLEAEEGQFIILPALLLKELYAMLTETDAGKKET